MRAPLYCRYAWAVVLCLLTASLHAQKNDTTQYWLIFSARPPALRPFSFTGHTFVSWAVLNPTDQVPCSYQTLGFYPKSEANMLDMFKGCDARIATGFAYNTRHTPIVQVAFTVQKGQWQTALDSAHHWHKKRYSLWKYNCVSFAAAVAATAHLNLPKTHLLGFLPRYPGTFLHKLRRKNPVVRPPLWQMKLKESAQIVFRL